MNTTWEWGHDWRKSRVPGLHLIEIAWERRPGEWFALYVGLLGVWGTWTIYRKRHVVSGFPQAGGEPIEPGKTFQFYEDNWPHNVPRESLGREHGA